MKNLHVSALISRAGVRLLACAAVLATHASSTAISSQWVAFNDQNRGPASSAKATFFTVPGFGASSGFLRDISAGDLLPVSLTITNTPGLLSASTMGSPAPGTPAYTIFNASIDWNGSTGTNGIQIFPTNRIGYRFAGLDPAKQYTFVGTSVRGGTVSVPGNEYSNRWTQAELAGAVSYTPAHSANVISSNQYPGALTGSQAAWNVGLNDTPTTGDVVQWDSIVPAPDGTFTVLCKKYSGPFPGGNGGNALLSYAFGAISLRITPFGISAQPQSMTVTPGDAANFSVSVFGGPPISYQWLKDGTNIVDATNQSYSVSNAASTDEGSYSVMVSNVNASVLSSNATLKVGFYPIAFTAEPPDQTVNEGASVSLSVIVSGALPYSIQWFKDGQPITDATNQTFAIPSATSVEAAPYYVTVSNRFSNATSRQAVINVFSPSAPGVTLVRFDDSWRYNQSGNDPGVIWKERNFYDSTWPVGQGVFYKTALALPEAGNTLLALTNPSGTPIITYYFRTHFNWPLATTNVFLIASNLLDDGAIYYLNDVEVARVRLPSGPVAYATLATNSPNNGTTYEVLNLPSGTLLTGDNVLAVELHQAAVGSVDAVFGLGLRAVAKASEILRMAMPFSPLPDQTVNEEQTAIFNAEVFGTPPISFEWFKDGVSLAEATNQSLTLPSAHPSNAGGYKFRAANRFNALLSGEGHLNVIPDTVPPSVTRVRANDLSNILVTFSEAVEPASATNPANYTFNPSLIISRIQVINSTTVLLVTSARDPQLDYSLSVSAVADLAVPPNGMGPGNPVEVRRANASTTGGLAGIQTVFLILMENQDWSSIKGSANCPYINSLLPQASYCSQYHSHNNLHPSEPNYIWLEAASNFGYIGDAGPSRDRISSTNHLSTLLKNAGVEWRGYMESLPNGSTGTNNIGEYVGRHNPFAFFDDVTTNYDYCTNHVRPFAAFASDLAANRIGRYNFITPNLTNDMHSLATGSTSQTRQGDTWLSRELPQILHSMAFSNNGVVFILWDESAGTDMNPLGMIVLSPLAKGGGYISTNFHDHSSTVRTMQDIFGLRPYLADAANAGTLSDLFMDMRLTAGSLSTSGQYQFNLTNLIPARSYYIQASTDFVAWTTISTNFTSNGTLSVTDADAANLLSRFYRAVQVP